MVRSFGSLCTLASLHLTMFAIGCGKNAPQTDSNSQQIGSTASSSVNTVNISHTPVKWQSIGNCWAYAALGWVESMLMRGPEVMETNFSETYVTYRHYEMQLMDPSIRELQTGGSFQEAADIIVRYGLITEGDFAPDEANNSKSLRQKLATDYLNESLKTGRLSKSRSPEVVQAELDAAFGVNIDEVMERVIPASEVLLMAGRNGSAPLDQVILSWREIYWPISYEDYPFGPAGTPSPRWNGKISDAQLRVMRRVMRAMNARYPVVINWFVDFRAMNPSGVFDLKTLKDSQATARQGYHSTVLEDYIAEGTDPITQKRFETPEGEALDELKSMAVQFGSIKSLIVKNSWGGSERLDRPSYERDGEKGYHKLGLEYLLAFIPQFDETTSQFRGYTTGVNSFVLPAGF